MTQAMDRRGIAHRLVDGNKAVQFPNHHVLARLRVLELSPDILGVDVMVVKR